MTAAWSKLGRWERALVLVLAAYLALWPFGGLAEGIGGLRRALQIALYIVGGATLAALGYRLVRLFARRFLWRVSRRMMAAYFFVGVVPLAFALLLEALGLLVVFGPMAAYLVRAEIETRAAALYASADAFAWQLLATPAEERARIGERALRQGLERYPHLMSRMESANGPSVYPPDASLDRPRAEMEGYRGVVRKDGRYYLGAWPTYEPGSPSLLVMAPLEDELLDEFLPGLGQVTLARAGRTGRRDLALAVEPSTPPASPLPPPPPQARLPAPAHPFDWPVMWPAPSEVFDWDSGERRVENVLALRTRPSAVARLILAQQTEEARNVASNLAWVLVGLFGVALAISTAAAVSLTRTVTGAVHDLYVGTRHIDRGDFAHRVPVRGGSQLTELARSFNSMTASIERLIVDSRERERLEAELGIAHEVQQQLFPRERPKLDSLDAMGLCRPARSVSGDFYDYAALAPGRVAFSFGDVAGKGISAALVMASVHSIVRTQLSLLAETPCEELPAAAARLVAETNRQLCAGTAPDKYTTLFFAVYDEAGSRLVYVNAGHLPPVLIRDGAPSRLQVTGMVVGAFPDAPYEASELTLQPGDLLVVFTDGASEPENPYEEQFGEDRLIELLVRESDRPLEEICETVAGEVADWTGHLPELTDDMTLLLARRR